MGLTGEEALGAARTYTKNSLKGVGALAGAPCQIQSITDITGGTGGKRTTFLWEDNEGEEHTSTMDVMNGEKGEDGAPGETGLGIKSVAIDANNHLIITYDDDTTEDAGEIDGGGGESGTALYDALDEHTNRSMMYSQNELSHVNDGKYLMLYVDDAREDLPDVWAVAQEYNIPLNLAVPTDKLDTITNTGKVMREYLKELQDAGCEIHSHSTDGNVLTVDTTKAEIIERLSQSKEELLKAGLNVHGYIKPGGTGAVSFDSRGFGYLIREFYDYSDCDTYPKGLNEIRISLPISNVNTFIAQHTSISVATKVFMHSFDMDVTEAQFRTFIEAAQTAGFEFITQYDYYRTRTVSIFDSRLKRLEEVLGNYTTLDWDLFSKGWGRPPLDRSIYPYLVLYVADWKPTVVASSDVLIATKDGSNNYVLKKSDDSQFSYVMWRNVSGTWTRIKGQTITSLSTNINIISNATFNLYDNNGNVIIEAQNYYN